MLVRTKDRMCNKIRHEMPELLRRIPINRIFAGANRTDGMNIDHNSDIPLHLQAEEILRQLIESEEYKNGNKYLPNEVELSRELDISRNTLRQAINKLVFEGRLIRKKGVGTKVAPRCILGRVNNWLSFSQEMKRLGIEVRNFELHISYKPGTDEIRTLFGAPQGKGRFFVLERVRGKKECPFVYFISYFNPGIPFSGEEHFSSQPLYDILEKEFGIVVKTSKEEISARLAGDFIASKLDIRPTDPILVRKRCVYDVNGQLTEYNIGYYRADCFTYSIEAER